MVLLLMVGLDSSRWSHYPRGGTCPISPLFARRTPLRPRLWPSEGGKFGHARRPLRPRRGQRRAPDSPRPHLGLTWLCRGLKITIQGPPFFQEVQDYARIMAGLGL